MHCWSEAAVRSFLVSVNVHFIQVTETAVHGVRGGSFNATADSASPRLPSVTALRNAGIDQTKRSVIIQVLIIRGNAH